MKHAPEPATGTTVPSRLPATPPGALTAGLDWAKDDHAVCVVDSGLHGGHARATAIPMYRVDDITAAVARVRAGGGTATNPQTRPYGQMSECTDDQGTHFYLGQH